jgi:hypothetical protein
LQNPVSVCAIHFAVRSKVASDFILAQPINSVEVAKLASQLQNFGASYK